LATQKPTVDVITGLIKSNLPSRICFKVAQKSDSRVVLDQMGADKLLGMGDLLFLPPGTSDLVRAQGAFASDLEINRVADYLESDPCYEAELLQLKTKEMREAEETGDSLQERLKTRDKLYEQAIEVVVREGRGSVSLLQRALGIGYGRASRLIDFMAQDGVVGAYNGSNAREVLYTPEHWHGIHEARGTKSAYDFHDLNVTGTFNVLEAAAHAGAERFLFISSTSASDRYGVYGHTKVLGEEMCRAYAHRHGMAVITLRPRAFIPSWNTAVYASFPEWAAWFARGAVHVDDVCRAVFCALDLLQGGRLASPAPVYVIDGAHDFTREDLDAWDAGGPGSTFRKYYPDDEGLMRKHGLDPARKPKVLDVPDEQRLPCYVPQYSLKDMLAELRRFDAGAVS
jgi:hypothetical protein